MTKTSKDEQAIKAWMHGGSAKNLDKALMRVTMKKAEPSETELENVKVSFDGVEIGIIMERIGEAAIDSNDTHIFIPNENSPIESIDGTGYQGIIESIIHKVKEA